MDISDTRRKRLRLWFTNRTLPSKEKSYLSQLMSGKASFGEKAARRLENTYGMPEGYLDQEGQDPAMQTIHTHGAELSRRDRILLELFHELPEREADALLKSLEDKKRHYDELYYELSQKRHGRAC